MRDPKLEERVRGYIRQRLDRRDIAEAEMARLLGIEQPRLWRILHENRPVPLALFDRVSHKLGIDPDQLLNTDPPERYLRPGPGGDPSEAPPSAQPGRRKQRGVA